jgi:hypothetical protein
MYLKGYAPSRSDARGLEGPAADTLYSAIEKAYWTRPELLPELEKFKVDGANFYSVFDDEIGNVRNPYIINSRTKARALMAKRDAYLLARTTVTRETISLSQPSGDTVNGTEDERGIRQTILRIHDAAMACSEKTNVRDCRDKERYATLTAATDRYKKYADAFVNPKISTATLSWVVEHGLQPLNEIWADEISKSLFAMAATSDGKNLREQRDKIESRLGGAREEVMRDVGVSVRRAIDTPRKEQQLHDVVEGMESRKNRQDKQAIEAIARAFLDPAISAQAIGLAVRDFVNYQARVIGGRAAPISSPSRPAAVPRSP